MEFNPVLRFAVMSDLHYHEEVPERRNRFAAAMETVYRYADTQTYKNVDALYIVGDFTDIGTKMQMQMLKEDCDRYVLPQTFLALTLANHELHYGESEEKALAYFDEIFSQPYDRHEVINGFHFISLSTTRDKGVWHDSFNDPKRTFLKNALCKAFDGSQNKPIFVFQHPGVENTSPGAYFGSLEIYDILKDYPNVVDFAGHSHVAVNDPREIHQRDFTVVGTGSLESIDSGRTWYYKDLSELGYDGTDYAQMIIVEADATGKVCVRFVDVVAKKVFGEAFIDVSRGKEGFTYTENRVDATPIFRQDAFLKLSRTDVGYKVLFPKAECQNSRVWYYLVKLINQKGETVKEEKIPSDFAAANQKATYEVEIPTEGREVSFAEIKAVGFFSNVSEVLRAE